MLMGGFGFKKGGAPVVAAISNYWVTYEYNTSTTAHSIAKRKSDWSASASISLTAAPVCGVRANAARSMIAFGSFGTPYIQIYTMAGVKQSNPGTLPDRALSCLAWSPDGTRLVCFEGSPFNYAGHVYNTSTWARVATISYTGLAAPVDCSYSPDGSKLAVANYSTGCVILNTSTWGQSIAATKPSGAGGCTAVATVDNTWVICGGVTSSPYLWAMNMGTGTMVNAGTQPSEAIRFIAVSHDKATVAVLTSAGNLLVYDFNSSTGALTKRTNPATMPESTGAKWGLGFTPDDAYIWTVGNLAAMLYTNANPPVLSADPISDSAVMVASISGGATGGLANLHTGG